MKRGYQESGYSAGKGKLPMERPAAKAAGELDELLASLGYRVRAADMAEVAQKLEELEEAIGSAQEKAAIISHLVSDTVHYNPSDLATWVQSVLSEFVSPPPLPLPAPLPLPPPLPPLTPPPQPFEYSPQIPVIGNDDYSPIPTDDFSQCESYGASGDLRAIVYGPDARPEPLPDLDYGNRERKRQKTDLSGYPVMLFDLQEAGIRLVLSLMACAEAVSHGNVAAADTLIKHITLLSVSQAGAMRKVATYFAEGLARRVSIMQQPQEPLKPPMSDLESHYYETCPFLKFAHFTANQAILEAFAGKKRVHVIDFAIKQGLQWPALMQALAVRPGGPPVFRLTGIGPQRSEKLDSLQEVGLRLARLAELVNIEFEFRGFVVESLADLEPLMLDLDPSEALAVNSIFELHPLLARPTGIERVLSCVRAIRPTVFTVVEQEANHNVPVFMDRFTDALHYYSTIFDSLEGGVGIMPLPPTGGDQSMTEMYFGRQICDVVACEGTERLERHEKLTRWRAMIGSAGFAPLLLGSNCFKQATILVSLFAGGDGFGVEENDGCMLLGWHARPLIAASAWYVPT